MIKLKNNIEERMEKVFCKKEIHCFYINYKGNFTNIYFRKISYNRGTPWLKLCLELAFLKTEEDLMLTKVDNRHYNHKELIEIINIIHNNLCNEENWEEVE